MTLSCPSCGMIHDDCANPDGEYHECNGCGTRFNTFGDILGRSQRLENS